jgi:Protein of unknown function (DUF1573)
MTLKHMRKIALALGAIFFLFCGARVSWRLYGPRTAMQVGDDSGLFCDGPLFDFGVKRTGQVVVHVFSLWNGGAEPVEVRNVRPGCSCVETELAEKMIQPHSSVPLKVRFSLRDLRGAVEKDVVVESSEPANRFTVLKMKGIAQSDFDLKPPSIKFGKVREGQPLKDKIDIQVNGSSAFHLQSIVCDSPLLLASHDTITPGKVYRVYVETAGNVPPGLWQTKLRIRTDDPREAEIIVPVVARVEAQPEAVSSR